MPAEKIIRYVATNDRGMRIGQYHPNAKLTDQEVEQIRDLHEFAGWGYRKIAQAYGVEKACVAKICRYEQRVETFNNWKRIEVLVTAADLKIVYEEAENNDRHGAGAVNEKFSASVGGNERHDHKTGNP